MAKIKLQDEEIFLLGYLSSTRDPFGEHYPAKDILETGEFKLSDAATRTHLQNLLKNSLIEVRRLEKPFHVRLTREGHDEYQQQISNFDHIKSLLDRINIEHLFRPANLKKVLKHALSTKNSDVHLIERGYQNQGLIGYIQGEPANEEDLIALKEYYLIDEEDYLYSTDESKESLQGHQLSSSKIIGYLTKKGDRSFHRFYRKSNTPKASDHFCCCDPALGFLEGNGYKSEDETIGEVYLWSEKQDRQPLYVYSKTPEVFLFKPLSHAYKFDAAYATDNVANQDMLGRDMLVQIIVDKVDKVLSNLHESYSVLLNGEWGSGKSSMLNFFETHLSKKSWKIVRYNAWENQKFPDPTWILVNKVSETISKKTSGDYQRGFASHRYWRFKIKNPYMSLFIFLFAVLAVSTYSLFSLTGLSGTGQTLALYGSLVGLIASIVGLVAGVIDRFQNNTSAQIIKQNISDPYLPIKNRFMEITQNQNVAIFIDDLDRCGVEESISLLEGIQTLFKQSRVLYIIAADGEWVSQCFNKSYEVFSEIGTSGQTVGDRFLEKSFQLILDVPRPNPDLLSKYFDDLLGHSEKPDDTEQEQMTEKTLQSDPIREKMESDLKTTVQEDKQKEENILRKFLEKAPDNPRQLKRLINQYQTVRLVLTIQGTKDEITEDELVNYVIFSLKCPTYSEKLKRGRITLAEIRKEIEELRKSELHSDENVVERYLRDFDDETIKRLFLLN